MASKTWGRYVCLSECVPCVSQGDAELCTTHTHILTQVAEVVIDQALKFGSRDNLSCCVVMLPGASRPTR